LKQIIKCGIRESRLIQLKEQLYSYSISTACEKKSLSFPSQIKVSGGLKYLKLP